MSRNLYAIIVAGGSGSRMQSDTPKQFMLLDELPVLMHTVLAFFRFSSDIHVILVLPKAGFETWKQLCIQHRFTHEIDLVEGGESRFHSVENGLRSIQDPEGLVAIHDGVRPLVNSRTIGTSFALAAEKGAAIASMELKESLRLVDGAGTIAVNRSQYRSIQTPQTFRVKLIKQAYKTVEFNTELTDDASVVEQFGHPVYLFDGDYTNIKITTPEDMVVASALIGNKKGDMV